LRTPITRAKLQLEFMEDGVIKDNLGDDINEIDLLISDLIEAERLSNQHAALLAEDVDFAEYIGLVLQQYTHYESLRFVRPEQDHSVSIDKLRTRLLLTNIVNNAIRHGEGKPITVTVSFEEAEAIVEVEDQGEGIAEEHLEHLSEPFYRADSARQRHTGGFGLGLYLCRLIAQAHGGRLEISSKLGVGTHVTLFLPFEREQPPEEEAVAAGSPARVGSARDPGSAETIAQQSQQQRDHDQGDRHQRSVDELQRGAQILNVAIQLQLDFAQTATCFQLLFIEAIHLGLLLRRHFIALLPGTQRSDLRFGLLQGLQ